jgi:hypothetical protein
MKNFLKILKSLVSFKMVLQSIISVFLDKGISCLWENRKKIAADCFRFFKKSSFNYGLGYVYVSCSLRHLKYEKIFERLFIIAAFIVCFSAVIFCHSSSLFPLISSLIEILLGVTLLLISRRKKSKLINQLYILN